MDYLLSFIAILVAVGVTYLTLKKRHLNYHSYRRIIPLKPRDRQILRKYFAYYNLLDLNDKKLFEQKVNRFIASKRFIPRQMKVVTPEMRVLIAAAAVQLTFGLPNVVLKHFDKIMIYLDAYYSEINKRYHKGEVNPAYGIIVLSWRNFVEGYTDPKDSLNLGIHEMAHALRFENVILNGEHSFFDQPLLDLWEDMVDKEIIDYKIHGKSFLRSYAYENEEEFFAVAVEVFFENPVGFKENKPELYLTLSALLNQDPVNLYGVK